ncbi:MAG: type 1 glutamine amidotransferase [Acidimicrobiia bacterium]|nr:type 1 glutamine amidotransferase [Acidimicrobiia bacterium]
MRVLILQHGDDITPGHLDAVLDEVEADRVAVHLHRGDRLPGPDGWDAVVVLGGEMGAYDEDDHPWLVDEKRFLAEVVDRDVPTLGICLGAQLLADALGGRAHLGEEGPEIGVVEVERTPGGFEDPVVRHLDRPTVVWHQDTFEVPPGATVLARTDRYPHAFRRGSALAIQAHPEADPDMVADWIEHVGPERLRDQGVDPGALRSAVAEVAVAQEAMARDLFRAWVAELPARG